MQRSYSGIVFEHDAAPMTWATVLERPAGLLGLFVAAHFLIWTIVPALVHVGMPMDVVEGYAIGREWVMGTFKHPAMPSWLLEMSRMITGTVGWPAYALSSLCIVITYWIVFLLGRDITDAPRAVAGTLLSSGILYFSWVTPEFNHNVLQMPLWAGLILALWRARETDQKVWWALVGALGGLGLYAKISTGVLLIVAALYIVVDPKCRARLGTSGPWIGLGIFLVVITPMVNWLVDTNFLLFEYAEARATRGRAGSVLLFLWKQIASSAGLLLLLLLAWMTWRPKSAKNSPRFADAPKASSDATCFLLFFFAAPIVFVSLTAFIADVGLKGSWGTSMLSLAGLVAIVMAAKHQVPLAPKRIIVGSFILLALIPASYALSVKLSDRFSKSPPRVAWPQNDISTRLQQIWRERTGQPLRVVSGDLWLGGMVAATATDRPSLLIDGDFGRSPWLDRAILEKHGALLVSWVRGGMGGVGPGGFQFPHVKVLGVEGVEFFHVNFGRQGRDLSVYYAIVPPGTKLKLGALNTERR